MPGLPTPLVRSRHDFPLINSRKTARIVLPRSAVIRPADHGIEAPFGASRSRNVPCCSEIRRAALGHGTDIGNIAVIVGVVGAITRRAPLVMTLIDTGLDGAIGVCDSAADHGTRAERRHWIPPAVGMTAITVAVMTIAAMAVIPPMAAAVPAIATVVTILHSLYPGCGCRRQRSRRHRGRYRWRKARRGRKRQDSSEQGSGKMHVISPCRRKEKPAICSASWAKRNAASRRVTVAFATSRIGRVHCENITPRKGGAPGYARPTMPRNCGVRSLPELTISVPSASLKRAPLPCSMMLTWPPCD